MAYIGREPQIGNFQVCDAISVVNGQAAYTMQVSSVNVSPETENHMLVSLNGILQRPGSSFTVSGSTITFASNLVTGDVINFIHILGSVLDLGVPSDSTVSLAKLTATGTKNATTFLRGDNTFAAAGGANTPAFEAYLNSRQNISDNTDTKVAFDVEVFDTGGQYDHSTNYRFTPTTSGKYFVYANVGMGSGDNSAFGTGNINIRKNGSDYVKGRFDNSSNSVNSMYKNISSVISMNGSGDYVEIFINVNTSSGTPFAEGNGNHVKASLFGAFKIIE